MFPSATDDQAVAAARTPVIGRDHGARAAEVLTGQRALDARDLGRRAGGYEFAAQTPGAGAEIDHVVRALDGLLVVLDDEHRVAQVAQARQRVEQALVVARMQADGRLVENIQNAAQPRADLRGQADALGFAAGERGRGTVEAQVVQPDFGEELKTVADLLDEARGDLPLAFGERPGGGRIECPGNRQRREIGD